MLDCDWSSDVCSSDLQDLKTGQLVDATPWRQQVALLFGVVAGSLVIPVILNLLNVSNGFTGATAHAVAGSTPLAAPQATLITTIAKGVIGGDLNWGLIGIGALVGAGLVTVDELLRRTGRYSLPPLGAALAIYLPAAVTVPVISGAVAGWVYNRRIKSRPDGVAAEQLAVLMVSGYIVGDSLLNVVHAAFVAGSGQSAPFALVGEDFAAGKPLALAAYIVVAIALYLWAGRRRAPAA
jgi:putative OPT family oligopeptide transporter